MSPKKSPRARGDFLIPDCLNILLDSLHLRNDNTSVMISAISPLVVDNLSFRYRDRQGAAIHNLSFTVNAGEVLLIVGASGCGKTTLVRCINGLIPRSYKGEISGQVLVFGEEVQGWKLSQISQKIGTVLQDPERQILGTKVVNEVAFGLENLGMPRVEIFSRVHEAFNFLKISHLRQRETFNLSGGEKQKVSVGRRACHAPFHCAFG